MPSSDVLPATAPVTARRQLRVAKLAALIQAGAVVWIAMVLAQTALFWGSGDTVRAVYGRKLGIDLSATPAADHALAAVLVAVVAGFGILVAVQVWRLAATYRRGGAFTVEAAVGLRRLAIAGALTLGVDIVVRHLVVPILTLHLSGGPRFAGPWLISQDLLYGVMVLFLFALSGIFHAAAEMADDHAAIV